MFPKPPKKEKERKGLKQKTPLKQNKKLEARTPLKQNKKLEARTPLKQNKKLEARTPLKQNKKLEARTPLKQNKKLEARTPLKQNKKLEARTPLKQNKKLEVKTLLKQNKKLKIKKGYKITKVRVNKRAIFSDFTKEEKLHIVERDAGKCIYCGKTTYLGVAHIFASRQKGGVGNRKNGVLLCQICHNALDNGKDSVLREKIQKYSENYLRNLYGDIKLEEIIYDKNKNNDKKAI